MRAWRAARRRPRPHLPRARRTTRSLRARAQGREVACDGRSSWLYLPFGYGDALGLAADAAVEGREGERDLVVARQCVAMGGSEPDRGGSVTEVPGPPGDADAKRVLRAVEQLNRVARRRSDETHGEAGGRSSRLHAFLRG